MYCVMIWSSSYGIIPALIFGFAGWTRKIQKYISTMCITDTSTSNNSSSNSSNSNSKPCSSTVIGNDSDNSQ